ncbi:Sjogren's syndrome/scleroderma autoantigen 1 family protein [Halorussus sp. AFM4]|uniref:Sjogren's syndrome/scleroderma autoantigen 1 family protein n=1 Tax=Halorussus sp. AFM4 TaxID=3421651 RepID=UPI003EBAC64B
MSSDDSGFDKEAEREKLREKYERDRKDRENTRRMSELLLQGATMTGKHCDQCGDPIFRYDGREFCPTCQHEAEAQAQQQNGQTGEQVQSDAEAGPDGQPGDRPDAPAEGAAPTGTEVDTAPTDDGEPGDAADESAADAADDSRPDDAGDEPRVEIDGVRVADRHVDRSNVRRPPSQTDADRDPARGRRESVRGRATDDRAGRGSERSGRDRATWTGAGRDRGHGHDHASASDGHTTAPTGATPAGADDLAAARESLVRKLSALARQAEQTDDVARARDLLAATREAAEALAALDRANR